MIKNIVWLSVLALAIFTGCKKPDSSIGLGNLPDSDLLTLEVTDTLTVEITSVIDDSLRTDQFSSGVLGRIFHPRIGKTSAGFAAQLRLSATNVDFGANPIADSISLKLRFTGSSYGEYSNHYVIVKQLITPLSLDSIYYSNFEPETQHEFLNNPFEESLSITPISEAVSEVDSTEAELKINLNLSLAQTLLGLDTAVYSSNDNWLEYFPGIVVNSMSGHGASGFDLSSGLSVMRIHYHNDTDTTHYDYVIGPTSSRINMFSNDYVSDLDDLYTFNPDSAYIPGDDLAYVMSGGGIVTSVQFPYLDSINSTLGEATAILKAELILTLDESYYDTRYKAPLLLGVGLRDSDGGLKPIPDQFSPTGVGGVFDKTTNEYHFNLTKTVQHILNRNVNYGGYGDFPPGDYVPSIYITSLFPGTSLEGVVLKGTNVQENRARLVLTCSH